MMEKPAFGQVYAIGRNYPAHAKELSNPIPESPLVFLKPTSSIIGTGEAIWLPPNVGRVDHEVEVVVKLGEEAWNVSEAEALEKIEALAIGIDVTARDVQSQAKREKHPWAVSKGYRTFAPVGNFVSMESIDNWRDIDFSLRVNDEVRQRGRVSDMLFSIPFLVSHLSKIFLLKRDDLIFTGSPSGVGPLSAGDTLHAEMRGGSSLNVMVRED